MNAMKTDSNAGTFLCGWENLTHVCYFAGTKAISALVSSFGKYSGYCKKYGYPMAAVTHMWSVYLVVLVTVQRYIAVCQPMKAKTWASVKAAKYEVIAMTVGTLVFYFPRLWQRKIVYNPNKDVYDAPFTAFGASYSFHMGFMVIAYYVVIYVIPLSVLVFTTYQLIRSLRKVAQRKREMASSHSQAHQGAGPRDEMTLSLVVVVVIFGISQLANPVSEFAHASFPLYSVTLQKSDKE